MDKERIKELASNPQFISGIYNYCDRWCERCPLTSRCMNFAMDEEQFSDEESRDINNEKFWEKLSETFQVTLDLLKETAEEQRINLDSLDTEETEEEERLADEAARDHECCRAAKLYAEMADNWFDFARDFFGGEEGSGGLEVPDIKPLGEATSLEDAFEVIRWYQHQIYVKLMRAVRGDLRELPEVLNEFPKDSDGSAKVALIGIDHSIAAWGEIRSHFPVVQKDIMGILVHLDRLRRNVEKAFPDARAFIRPGFDKIDLNS